ncbi:MAG: diguanylate cyclase [Bacillota bacterium]|nr:diguanylate cyclase [Bacillota bacterium]MDW7730312.1 diguanylate cyclase [Bacillota bacterium]
MIYITITVYLFFAVLLTVYIATYTYTKGKSTLTKIFTAMSFCLSVYLFGYLMELNSTSLEQMHFWNQIQYLTLPFFPSFWLAVSLLYTNNSRAVMRPVIIGAIFFIPIITFFVRLTNDYHHLYYSSMTLNNAYGLSIMQLEKGIWYLLHSAYLALIYFFTAIVYLKYSRKAANPTISQYKSIIIGITLPFVGLILIVVDAGRIGIDYAALLMPIALLFLALAVFKFDFLKLKTLARETVFENSADAMILLNTDNILIDYNPAAAEIFWELKVNVKGESINNILKNHPDFLQAYKTGKIKDLQLDTGKYYEMKVIKAGNDSLNTFGYLISLTDITARNIAREKLIQLATTDELTGLSNRRHFINLATQEFDRAKRYGETFSILMIDIDYFKSINDTIGHSGGDAILREFGLIMNSFFRSTDFAGRLGGEEFAIILPKLNIDSAHRVAEKFRKEIAKAILVYENNELSFTVSLGIAAYSDGLENFEQLVKLADQSLYEAKRRGRNCTVASDPKQPFNL